MNERQFQNQLAAEAPMSVPDSLRDRVEAIAEGGSTGASRPDPDAPLQKPTVLGLKEIVRKRWTMGMLLAAILAVAAVGLGSIIRMVFAS
jgi:hypothetical protein